MLKRWCGYLAVLLGLMVLYVAYQEWLSWLCLVGCLAMPIFSFVVSLPGVLTARFHLGNRGSLPAGTEADLRAQIQSPFPLPVYRCRIRVTNVLTGENRLLNPGDPLPTAHCGKLELTPEKCRIYDYFGLFYFPIHGISAGELLLRPREIQAKVPKELERYIARSWQPKPGGGFSENHEMRLYRPGDSMNQIHWKLTAKTGKLIIREAMEPARGRILLTLDLSGEPEILDRKLEKLLFLGTYMVEQGLRFQLHALTGDGRLQWRIQSQQGLETALDQLLGCKRATEGSIATAPIPATWRFHIGGEPDEA